MVRLALFSLLFAFGPAASAGTIYVATKDYPWPWEGSPSAYDDFQEGGNHLREWLEARDPPRLLDPPKALRTETKRHFELDEPVTVRFAVIGAPRSTNGHDPYFFAWIEWVADSKSDLDQIGRRAERNAGVARVAIEGEGERHVEIREWHPEKELRQAELEKVMPWDAAVVARKLLDLHAFRPRNAEENASGPGKDADY